MVPLPVHECGERGVRSAVIITGGFSEAGFVALGNRADVDESDLIAYFNPDSNTAFIAAYIEGIKRPSQFMAVVNQLKKPLVVLKPGRTPKRRVAAESHTRSLAGADAIYDAPFAKQGICRTCTVEEFHDFAKAFAYLKPPRGNRILFVTTSGGIRDPSHGPG
jgi:acyl-CoA synthetase (NDP forming)